MSDNEKSKFVSGLEKYHGTLNIVNKVILWGGSLLLFIGPIAKEGFPDGLANGLFIGGIYFLVAGLRFRKSEKGAKEAREYFENKHRDGKGLFD